MNINNQTGATLFVALIFLVIMTLFAVSSINMSTVNLQIVGNMQAIKQMEGAAQDAIEQMLSNADNYGLNAAGGTITTTVYTATSSFPSYVDISDPICVDSQTATGYSAVQTNIIPEDNTWEFIAEVEDPVTGAKVKVHQGIEMRMLAGNCPNP